MENINEPNDIIINLHNPNRSVRSALELWLIVEENFDMFFLKNYRIYLEYKHIDCLCNLLDCLFLEKIINFYELVFLSSVLKDYGKKRFKTSNIRVKAFWRLGEKKPRRMFIQKQILKELRK